MPLEASFAFERSRSPQPTMALCTNKSNLSRYGYTTVSNKQLINVMT